MKKKEVVLVAAEVPADEVGLIDAKAAQLGVSRSEFVRRAVRAAQVIRVEVNALQSQPLVAA